MRNYPQESLREALLALLRQQISAFLIFWIVVSVPAVCQYHSMMTLLDIESDIHHGHDHAQHKQQSQSDQTECAIHDHSTSAHLMLLSSIPAIMPDSPLLNESPQGNIYLVAFKDWPPELIIPPPEQPPRLS